MVDAKEIKRVMSVGELAIRIKKRWITRDSLVQQIDRLEGIPFPDRRRPQKNIFGARVEIERADVARRRTLDCVLFTRRKFSLQLISNRLRDLALNGEHVRQIAVICLPPYVSVRARVHQLRVDAYPIAGALNTSFHHMRHT